MESQLDKRELLDLGFDESYDWHVEIVAQYIASNDMVEAMARMNLETAYAISDWPNDIELDPVPLDTSRGRVVFRVNVNSRVPDFLFENINVIGYNLKIKSCVKQLNATTQS